MNDISETYKNFTNNSKSIIIAPAGYGKTHTIAESIKLCEGHQLILTHTNAGVASIKEKIKKLKGKTKYTIETITGFAQKYVQAFYVGGDMPEHESNEYFPFILDYALDLFKKKAIIRILKSNYKGLFVDEYQDCTISQHNLISELAKLLPIHILGDPLQGIFDFNNEELVNFERDLSDYKLAGQLEVPWRWKNSNADLGEDLKILREKLETDKKIDLNDFNNIEKYNINERDLYIPRKYYNGKIWSILNREKSLLLIYPLSHNLNARINIIKGFNNILYLVEAMDSKAFYTFSKEIDACTSQTIYKAILKISESIFNPSKLKDWLGEKSLKNKREESDKNIIKPLKNVFSKLENKYSLELILAAFKLINDLPYIKCYRKELYNDLCAALEIAIREDQTVYDSMRRIRDTKRHIGKSIVGKCIGTTLLTKGLEFETVVILNAHKFKCHKNFYVAMTRAVKRLVVFTEDDVISFN